MIATKCMITIIHYNILAKLKHRLIIKYSVLYMSVWSLYACLVHAPAVTVTYDWELYLHTHEVYNKYVVIL